MEASELMIGDFVRSKIYQLDVQVYGIERNLVKVESRNMSFSYGPHYMKDVEPIPLTVDIIMHNYSRYPSCMFTWKATNENAISIEARTINDGRHVSATLLYVHELQHVLRMCGLDDEIEIVYTK